MEENKKSNYKIIVVVLALLLVGALGYTYYISDEHEKLTDEIETSVCLSCRHELGTTTIIL